ncbi:glycosyltransferase family 4 protein [Anaerosalibacter bizertensis]|uniref:Glycosyltransferase family 4 protein n=1 Tax=Anaerosalibacter bizertensis TaxID=932217 RepID=A0A844FKD1_9FIRM|nr:glycosyltransferase family 4 protein [Anaerosalibacter bizertensis]MSS44400.1 glycosyltransferase family 4 protein [Anaerosalibacter bizertensis]
MKILKLSPYYEPEQIASSHFTRDLEEAYINAGFEIEIYTPTPTRGVSKAIREKYKKIKYEEKYDGKIKVHRFAMFAEGKNPILRAIRYILCNIAQYFKGIRSKNIDIIITGSTPPTQGMLVALIKRKLNVPVIYNLQDIFPDSLVNTGLTKKGSFLWKIGHVIEKYTYENADKIVVISEDFKKNIMDKGVPEEKIEVIYNWVDENEVVPINKNDNILFEKCNLNREQFYVVYAGNLGYAQNIGVILKAAERLIEYSDIKFVIFGGGQLEDYYKDMARNMKLENVVFFPLQPYSLVSNVYSLGDVSIVSCKEGFGKSAMPSKTWSIMSAATAVVANFDVDTDLHRIIENNKVGLFTKAGDYEGLKNAILELYRDRELCTIMGRNGREFILNNLTRGVGTQRYLNVIKELEE